ncbi:hypothetical protein Y88_3414 [Novosphingobium nitrogenifigens DSM 19370]|uniref:Uncharacterized protein n=1 Tax=Novosphingobium nitrogenifigens DSM 19370 TaxID=983920 RepID=F1Z3A3_9SPHN|nr:hypothetical protein Y88_3414 [Novosphingobium nitrogenifigens DSM 19370]
MPPITVMLGNLISNLIHHNLIYMDNITLTVNLFAMNIFGRQTIFTDQDIQNP